MNDIGQAIKAALTAKGYTQRWLAEQVGVSDNAVSKWIKSGKISKEHIPAIAVLLDVPVNVLLDVDGVLLSSNFRHGDPHAQSNAEEAPVLGALTKVPVVGSAKLGDNGYRAELEYPVGHGDGFVEFPSRDKQAYALRCIGDSMRPRIKDGEFVVIYPTHAPHPGDEVLVKTTDGRVMVKELAYIRDDVMTLLSVNEAHGKMNIPLQEVEKCHYVAGIIKRAQWSPV